MLGFRRKRKRSVLDDPIDNILTRMNDAGMDSQKYNECVDRLDRLMEMKENERKFRIDPNTVLIVLGNLLGILVIVAYEQKHVMVSRALGFVNRTEPRI
jgi:hypothetical protein